MNILVIAEHDNRELKSTTLNTVSAASQLGGDIHILVAGIDCGSVVKAAAGIAGVSKVLMASHPAYAHQLAENTSALVADLCVDYDYLLAPATADGKNLLPRVAALLDVEMLSEVIAVVGPDTFKRPIYAGNVIATEVCSEPKKVLTVRGTAFKPAPVDNSPAELETLEIVHDLFLSELVEEALAQSDRPDLTAARVVVSGGRGMQNGDNFHLLETIADKLGGAVGASRAAVDAGYVPNDMQVGQTGKIVAPELYVAVGISGAIQHLAGMKDSKIIVAINKDEDAPIFQVADYGLVADLFDVLPELSARL